MTTKTGVSATAERDWKTQPVVGDIVKGKYHNETSCRRTVTGVTPLGNVFYKERGHSGHESLTGPQEWFEFCATAEIIRRGDAQQGDK